MKRKTIERKPAHKDYNRLSGQLLIDVNIIPLLAIVPKKSFLVRDKCFIASGFAKYHTYSDYCIEQI